jgi:hypothetical protein
MWLSDDKGEVIQAPTEPDGRGHKLRLGQRTGHVAVLASMSTRQVLGLLLERDSTELGATPPVAKGQTAALAAIPKEPVSITAKEILSRPQGTTSPYEIALLSDIEIQKLTVGGFEMTDDAAKWALTNPDYDIAELKKLKQSMVGRSDRYISTILSQWYSDAIHVLTKDDVGKMIIASVMGESINDQAKDLVANVLERHRHSCKRCGGEGTVIPEGETEPVACPSCHGTGSVKRRQEAVPSNPSFSLRPISDEEWQGFQGAEATPTGERPLVGEVDFGGRYEALVIVDANSVQIHFDVPQPGGGYQHVGFMHQTPYAQGTAIAQQVARMTSIRELVDAGFEQIAGTMPENFADIPPSGGLLNEPPEEVDNEPDFKGQYGWIITWANPEVFGEDNKEVGTVGPRNNPFPDEKMKAEGKEFQIFDDDGIHYYSGFYIGLDDESLFGPLEDYGTPNAGATEIRYKNAAGAFETI